MPFDQHLPIFSTCQPLPTINKCFYDFSFFIFCVWDYIVQLTLEQHRFELHRSICTWIFFQYIHIQFYTILSWLNLWQWNLRYGRLTVKLCVDFWLCGGVSAPKPCLVQGSTVVDFLWFISLSIMPSRFVHVVSNGRISFFFVAE